MYFTLTNHIQNSSNTSNINTSSVSFKDVGASSLSAEHFGRTNHPRTTGFKATNEQMKAFITVQVEVTKYKGQSPVYKSMSEFKKDQLIDLCVEYKHKQVQPRQFTNPTTTTTAMNTNDVSNEQM